MHIRCPLSGSKNVELIETVKTADIIHLYSYSFGFDITSEFGELDELGLYHCSESDLTFFSPSVTGSEAFYTQLQTLDWYYVDHKYEYDYAKKMIKATDTLLEIGCGKGAFATKIPDNTYVGLEFSQSAQTIAAANGIKIFNQSVQEHAIAHDSEYDVVCSFQVLEHVADIQSFIQSCLSCLKPGGLLLYSVPSADSFVKITRNSTLNMPPHHVSWWTDQCLTYVAKQFDLELVTIEHEKLDDVHRKWYAFSITLEFLRKLLRLKIPLVDLSKRYKLLAKIATFGSGIVEQQLTTRKHLPDGHSAIAVYRKTY